MSKKYLVFLSTNEEVTKEIIKDWMDYFEKCGPISAEFIEEITVDKKRADRIRIDIVTQGLKDNDPDTLKAKMVIQRLKELKQEFKCNNVFIKVITK